MPRGKSTTSKTNGNGAKTSNGAKLGFEQTLWAAADKQRGHMDAAKYKHVVLGLIFLKYISDAFQELYDSLDDKIELNQQMNGTLEVIARAIFKSWFVDFDPVCAKMDGRQPAGMDAATADLFPDSFKDWAA